MPITEAGEFDHSMKIDANEIAITPTVNGSAGGSGLRSTVTLSHPYLRFDAKDLTAKDQTRNDRMENGG